jgi:Zn finger protein HypA/HybF involved in hydrogenase expression
MATAALAAPVVLKVHCAHCGGAIELECEALPPYMGYRTYHEYFCPHCRKRNVQITTGAIASARPSA